MANVCEQLAIVLGKEPTDIMDIRKTDDIPPRVCVLDVVGTITGQSTKNARLYYERLAENYPEVRAKCSMHKFRGRGQGKVPVTDAQGIVEIIMLLQGRYASRVRQQAAKIFVRYLGGDLSLVDEVCRNRSFQEDMAVQAPTDPLRLYGEAVERTQPQNLGSIAEMTHETVLAVADAKKIPILQAVQQELRKIHPWDFHKHMRHNNPLVDVGVILDGDSLAKLDDDEHIIRITDYLQEKVAPESWRRYGNKFKNIFAIELKKHKVEMCEELEQPLYIARVQGEYRIVYTDADDELMAKVFGNCKRRFQGIATRDEALLKSRRKQRRIEDYFNAADAGVDQAAEREMEEVSYDAGGEQDTNTVLGSGSATSSRPASSSDVVVLHRETVAQAPANIRFRAKRGDANVHVTGS